MTCLTCKVGTTRPGTTTVLLEKNGSLVILKEVPAQICDNCGERYFDSSITKKMLEEAESVYQKGAELEIINITKAAA
ncbi:type II toxin-antitoxin system MqsA family antitoxin [Larkinella terrae]|uniref:YgiT-type zinc finger protein n=1 Tax=Larkinella terrae TaxID=2025311 RepID=A0A7K0EDN2_9BACT|nr:type II toxin-antitoxin system MqsA family antitoxin [Larkinella terrae]MRS59957.1 YgiT-type zinc finger protein [Larkinella terrae]